MQEPAHYVTSDYYEPGLINEVGSATAVVLLILILFLAMIVGSRIILRRSRRLSPTTRRLLRIMGGVAKPAAPISFGWFRRRNLGTRRKTEAHYKMQLAPTPVGAVPERAVTPVPLRTERPLARQRMAADLSPLADEAWPFYAEDEIDAATAVLRSGKVNQWTGTRVFEFEQAYTRYLRNGRAIAVTNGSVALELALRAFGIGPGDEVIVTPRSFVASAFCVCLVGATPVFADVDRDSGNITAETIRSVVTPRTKAVIPVHIGGWPTDMRAIMALAKEDGFTVIEDCAQAHGGEIDGLPIGSFGDAATFSFCQDKIISTGGEGGLVTFRDDAAYEWAWSFKDHGKDRRRALERATQPGFRWLHDAVGTNWRMTEIAAAIGLIQMDKLPRWRSTRAKNAEIWADALASVPGIRAPLPPRNINGAFYKFYAYLDCAPEDNQRLRDMILAQAGAQGIRVFSGSCSEMYREAAFADLGVEPLPVAAELGASSLMFEVHPTLDPMRLRDRADAVARIARSVIEGAQPQHAELVRPEMSLRAG